ncbi:hypothetical protein JCM30471_03540 [Desulfuromonas carbonis]
MYGTVRTVVWEDGGGDPASYPMTARKFECLLIPLIPLDKLWGMGYKVRLLPPGCLRTLGQPVEIQGKAGRDPGREAGPILSAV